MTTPYSVALLGFSPFERNTLASYFRLVTHRSPSYVLEQTLGTPDLMVADADHAPSVQLALAEDMLSRTVFIGTQPPAGATAWMHRPIDPLHVIRELDAMVPLLSAPPVAAASPEPHGDDLPTVIRPQPAEAAPPAHGQRAVALPRRRRGTIEAAFDGGAPGRPWPKTARPARPAAAPLRPAPETPVEPPPPRALLVDDSELARHFLARLLQPWGVVCDQAPASQQALVHLAERDYDFIFLDLELGPDSDLDGLTLCQRIKRLHSDVQAALATVVGVLIEGPVMLLVVYIVNTSKPWYERG